MPPYGEINAKDLSRMVLFSKKISGSRIEYGQLRNKIHLVKRFKSKENTREVRQDWLGYKAINAYHYSSKSTKETTSLSDSMESNIVHNKGSVNKTGRMDRENLTILHQLRRSYPRDMVSEISTKKTASGHTLNLQDGI